VIKMWKLQGAEPLAVLNLNCNLHYTENPISFDLLAATSVPSGGDLQVIITRSPGPISQRSRGDWSIQLIPVNGGIMEPPYNTSYVTFEAPENGYQSNYLVEMKHDEPAWFDNINKAFFLVSRNRQVYSKFSLSFRINNEPDGFMYFTLRGVANTNGSRNWEATAPQ
jgi:hypothetical protein